MKFFICLFFALTIHSSFAGMGRFTPPMADPKALVPFEQGGSNYVMLSIGDYLSEFAKGNDVWGDPIRGVKPLIAKFHENPQFVEQTLRAMYNNGQRKIALMLWYSVANSDLKGECSTSHVIVLHKSGACIKIFENLNAFLRLANEVGFDEVYVRFAQQAENDYLEWTEWHEDRYSQAKQFIEEVRDTVEFSLSQTFMKRTYDLCVECAGFTTKKRKFAREYLKRIWMDYVESFGASDSVLSSVIYTNERFADYIAFLKNLQKEFPKGIRHLVLPKELAIDYYNESGMFNDLRVAQTLLNRHGLKMPVVITETFLDNCPIAKDLADARKVGINVRTVFQWPLLSPTEAMQSAPHFSTATPVDYRSFERVSSGSVTCF